MRPPAPDDLASSMPGLFCSPEERAVWEHAVTDALLAARTSVAEGRVTPVVGVEILRSRLAPFDFRQPRPLADAIGFVIDQLKQGLVQITHPRYFGLFNPAPTLPAELADRIVAAFNPQLATATTSPAAVAIERHVIQAFAERVGFPETAGGHFATGGSEANFTALISALSYANRDFVNRGIGAFAGPPVFYVSEDAHVAWYKIAVQSGVGHAGVRAVATDAHGRMDVAALADMIESDRQQGLVPVMVSATAGTTGAGMIDPLHACADIAERHGLWYHVDGAWGGAAVVSETMRGLLAGIERAHSITIDAHKWLATTMACSLFLTRLSGPLRDAFHIDGYFMPSSDHAVDPYMMTVQWSRRFIGLRLFLALAAVGWQGYGEHVERSVGLADLVAERLRAAGWTIVNESRLAVVCAVPPEGSRAVGDIARGVLDSGQAWVSCTRFKGQDALRICPVNGQTTADDVRMLVDLLNNVRKPGYGQGTRTEEG